MEEKLLSINQLGIYLFLNSDSSATSSFPPQAPPVFLLASFVGSSDDAVATATPADDRSKPDHTQVDGVAWWVGLGAFVIVKCHCRLMDADRK